MQENIQIQGLASEELEPGICTAGDCLLVEAAMQSCKCRAFLNTGSRRNNNTCCSCRLQGLNDLGALS